MTDNEAKNEFEKALQNEAGGSSPFRSDISGGPGYYSWVCFISTRKGVWAGPIPKQDIQLAENGLALNNDVKSFTRYQEYNDRPTNPLTCIF